jgi:MSHA pilin protein MshD
VPETHRPAPAFTLVEVLVAAAVLAMAVAGLAQVIVTAQALTREGLHHARAVELGEALLEEILARPYADPDGPSAAGPEAGESSRLAFDNADDFDGFNEAAGALSDAAGNPYPAAYDGCSRRVAAGYGAFPVSGFKMAVPGLTVTLIVEDAEGQVWTLTRFVAEPSG